MTQIPEWARSLQPLCEGLARLLSPHAEIVLHDVESDTIVGIWNPFSDRKVGDPALLEDLTTDETPSDVMGPYEKVAADGRRITSMSSIFANEDGAPVGLVCINLDRSPMDQVIEALNAMVARAPGGFPDVLLRKDWREQIALAVDHWCREQMVDRRQLTRAHRLELVRTLDEADLFATRNAAQHAAVALGVSRATIYTMLREVRGDENVAIG